MKKLFLMTLLIGNVAFAETERCNCPTLTCNFKHTKTSEDKVDTILITHDITKPLYCELIK